jgi:hypothetical protein
VEGNWQESRQTCKSRRPKHTPIWTLALTFYVGMRAICERAFWENIVQAELRRSFGCLMEAPMALRSEKLACFDTHCSGAGTLRTTFDVRLDLSLSISTASRCGRIWLAQVGVFLFRFDSIIHARLIHKIFDSSNDLIWLHDEWKGCVCKKGLSHIWDWILYFGS